MNKPVTGAPVALTLQIHAQPYQASVDIRSTCFPTPPT